MMLLEHHTASEAPSVDGKDLIDIEHDEDQEARVWQDEGDDIVGPGFAEDIPAIE